MDIKKLLDENVISKNTNENLFANADPLQIATLYKDPYISLICALFAYGNAKLIVKFLKSLDFSLINKSENEIAKAIKTHKYRFQNENDVKQIFITISRLKKEANIEEIVKKGFDRSGLMVEGINELIKFIYSLNSYRSDGFSFFFGNTYDDSPQSTYKRYNMFLRWMVRDSDIDLGLFKRLPKNKLLIPLDVHTHKVSLALGLIKRRSYDFKAVTDLSLKLREFDLDDPIKYDFALYRIGQMAELNEILKNF